MAKRKIEYDKYSAGIFRRTEGYADKVRGHFEEAVNQLLKVSASVKLDEGELFSFSSTNRLSRQANEALRGLYANVYYEIRKGITMEWEYANLSADALIRSIFGSVAESDHFARYFARNQESMDAFLNRSSGGLNLSDKVWKYTDQLKDEMELALSVALGKGESASTMSRQVRSMLQEPDKLFRRVRDEKGNLQLSKRAAEYHPGRGVYRSSYKNAMRLTRTETNMAYRTADHERWQQMDFVIGIEIHLSNNHTCMGKDGKPHPFTDICDELAGKYPKSFKFTGWHPQCRCFVTPIMSELDDMLSWGKDVLKGKSGINDYKPKQITEMPANFKKWLEKNSERIKKAEERGSLPYFLRDNRDVVNNLLSSQSSQSFIPATLDEIEKHYDIWNDDIMNMGVGIDKFDFIGFKERLNGILNKYGVNYEVDRGSIQKISDKEWSVTWSSQDEGFIMTRQFIQLKDGGIECHHYLLQLNEELQGKGISKQIFRELLTEYKRVGVTKLTVDANIDVGGYTWAKYGFNANSKQHALQGMRSCRSRAVREEAKKVINDYYDTNGLTDWEEFPMHIIAEKEWGKEYLLGSAWSGSIDLMNDSQASIFYNYVYK